MWLCGKKVIIIIITTRGVERETKANTQMTQFSIRTIQSQKKPKIDVDKSLNICYITLNDMFESKKILKQIIWNDYLSNIYIAITV